MSDSSLPLDGVRVLDLSRLLPGPFCSLLLADMGADVLKLEDTRGGDYARHYPPFVQGQGAFFAAINRNKRSIALDLKSEDGRRVLESLLPEVDVLLESFRPGVMERLGLGLDALREKFPRLITCSISGFGQDGPLRDRAGHDIGYLAMAGLLEQNGTTPVTPGFQVADIAGGALYAALGITGALFQRERTGKGRGIDISMTEGALSLHLPVHAELSAGADVVRGEGMLTGGVPCYGVYETQDGGFIAVGALEPKFWQGFVAALGVPELVSDGLSRGERGAEVRARLEEVFKTKTREAWAQVLAEVDVCCEPVYSPAEVVDLALHKARGVFFEVQGLRHVRTPVTPREREHTAAPGHGEHTEEVLCAAGWSEEDVSALREKGVIM